MTFEQTLAAIDALQRRGWRLGLDRMQELVHRANLDGALGGQGRPQYLHVAGTNGKGSVTAYIESVLCEQGWRTGGYFSPYVYDIRERIRICGEPIDRESFTRIAAQFLAIGKELESTELEGPTEFELKTALGLAYWEENDCDYVALEVGLGGRLDATNVVTPAACTIVSIGLDHTAILGPDEHHIATEKAGILKPGVPAVVGHVGDEAREAISEVARAVDAPIWWAGREVTWRSEGSSFTVECPAGEFANLTPGLVGPHQVHNMAIAVATCAAARAIRDASTVGEGVRKATLAGRFEVREWHGRRIILDGAHNAAAAEALADTLGSQGYRDDIVLLTGMLEGHDPGAFFAPLVPWVRSCVVTKIDYFRTRQPEELAGILRAVFPHLEVASDARRALDAVLRTTQPGDTILVTGSFYLVGEVGRLLSAEAV